MDYLQRRLEELAVEFGFRAILEAVNRAMEAEYHLQNDHDLSVQLYNSCEPLREAIEKLPENDAGRYVIFPRCDAENCHQRAAFFTERGKYCTSFACSFAVARELFEAVKATEDMEDVHANCEDCEDRGAESPELGCERCFNLADDARLKRRAVMAKLEGKVN